MVMTVPMPFGVNGPGLLVNPLLVPVAVLVLVRMHVPGLPMDLRAVPLAILVPFRTHVPGSHLNLRAVPLAMLVAPGVDVPGSRMLQPQAPSVSMVPRMPMPSPVVTMDDEGTVVRSSQSHADAERFPVRVSLSGRWADQSADDAAHDRTFPRPFVIGAGGRLRHGRAERDGGCERDCPEETLLPALHHRHPPDLMGGPWRGAPAD